ncbi:MAG: hypothetical protein ABL998_02330 [Planctomycetota bacterium]
MVLLVLILILAQIKYSTDSNGRVARNEETLALMDNAIESALLQVMEDLKTDAESDAAAGAGGEGGGAGDAGGGGGLPAGGDGGGGEESGPTDSKEDEWARAQRTEINEIQLRILVQDEDSKFNVLSVLTENEEEAEKALDRLARVIEWSRKGTRAEIDGSTARRMAEAMAEYMRRRTDQSLPRPELLSDSEEQEDIGLPLSLREFQSIDPELFPSSLFQDYLDEEDKLVHSLGTFLTVWSSVGTVDEANSAGEDGGGGDGSGDANNAENGNGETNQDEGPDTENPDNGGDGASEQDPAGAGGNAGGGGAADTPPGWAMNLNTAPGAVLHALMDERDLPYRFWDDVLLYRNEKDETVEENEDPPLDEYGRQILVKQFFHSTEDLSKVDGWENLEPIVQGELKGLLKVQSGVFSIFITARKPTGEEQIDPFSRGEDIEREEANWQGLVRTVRAVLWRRPAGEGEVEMLSIVRWEELDYVPFEVLDFPEAKRFR